MGQFPARPRLWADNHSTALTPSIGSVGHSEDLRSNAWPHLSAVKRFVGGPFKERLKIATDW